MIRQPSLEVMYIKLWFAKTARRLSNNQNQKMILENYISRMVSKIKGENAYLYSDLPASTILHWSRCPKRVVARLWGKFINKLNKEREFVSSKIDDMTDLGLLVVPISVFMLSFIILVGYTHLAVDILRLIGF